MHLVASVSLSLCMRVLSCVIRLTYDQSKVFVCVFVIGGRMRKICAETVDWLLIFFLIFLRFSIHSLDDKWSTPEKDFQSMCNLGTVVEDL